MSHSGNVQPQLDLEEHLHAAEAKRVAPVLLDPAGQYSNRNVPDFSTVAQTFTLFSATASATLILPANTARKQVIFQRNTGVVQTMRVGPTSGTLSTMGILMPSGALFQDSGDGIYMGDWYVITASSAESITAIEFI